MDEREADVALARVDAVAVGLRHVAPGQRPDGRLAPQTLRGLDPISDVEPQEEAAGWTVEPETPLEDGLRGIDLLAIARPILGDVILVAPQRGGGGLDRQRDLACAVIAQAQETGNQLRIARDEAGAQRGGARA